MSKPGFVYILTSKNCKSIKIGGSDYPPIKRIKEINNSEPYKSLGPWHLSDFRQVTDWRGVEYHIHYSFRSFLNKEISNQKELFDLSPKQASDALKSISSEQIINKPKVDRMFNDIVFRDYLMTLLNWSGLTHWLDYQGAWTLVLFPSTSGGRYFTINIGGHEVAYATLNKGDKLSQHALIVDCLILDCEEVIDWVEQHDGFFVDSYYKSALPRAISVIFSGDFKVAQEFLQLPSVRRAMIAYWHDALYQLKDNAKLSLFSRFHNYNAVAKLVES